MKKKSFLTQKDLLNLLDHFHIHEGSHVCVQCSDAFCDAVIGGAQSILEVFMERIQEGGCLFMPTFSYSCLDPACQKEKIPLDVWKTIRENQYGYHSRLTSCDDNGVLANQFLKNDGVIRTSHPVYSFAFWGFVEEKMLAQKSSYPISFSHVLMSFAHHHGINVLLDVDPHQSVLLPAVARTLHRGDTGVQRAYMRKGNTNQVKTYLVQTMDQEVRTDTLQYCFLSSTSCHNFSAYRIVLDEYD